MSVLYYVNLDQLYLKDMLAFVVYLIVIYTISEIKAILQDSRALARVHL
jgi:hypothetical protein